jgi:hypothetical protein
MTEETKKIYEKDLKMFYKIFTQQNDMPESIKKFSDIKLRDYSKNKLCDELQPLLKEAKGTYKNELFANYANNLKKMMININDKQNQLLEIINDLFVYDSININKNDSFMNDSKNSFIRINPELNDKSLQELINKSRTLIMELYLKCEEDFLEGIKLYESIVESQILETTQKQITTLEREMEKIYNPYILNNK